MEDFKLQPLKTHRTNQTKGALQYLKPLLLYFLIHCPPLVIPTIRSFLLPAPIFKMLVSCANVRTYYFGFIPVREHMKLFVMGN